MKAVKVSIILDDPDEAEHFLRGLIVARSNNSSELFVELIDGVNGALVQHREEALLEQIEKRKAAGMP